MRLIAALAIVAAAIYAYTALAAAPSSSPAIVNANGTAIDGVQIANASVARATDNLFTI